MHILFKNTLFLKNELNKQTNKMKRRKEPAQKGPIPEPAYNKILQITSRIYIFFLFSKNVFVYNSKVFIFLKQELLMLFLIS